MFPTLAPRAPAPTLPAALNGAARQQLVQLLRQVEAGRVVRSGGTLFYRYLLDGVPFNWRSANGAAAEVRGLVTWAEDGTATLTAAGRALLK